MLDNPTFRATVVYSNSQTGEIRVRIPTLGGLEDTVPISYIGRTSYNGVWPVPAIGSQIVVTSSDEYLYNVYWVQVQPATDTSSLESRINDLESKVDALMLGIFS